MGFNTVTVTTSATLIVGANTQRQSLIIDNTSAQDLYIGPDDSVTTANGTRIVKGGNLTETNDGTRPYMGPYYGIVGATTSDIRYWERLR